MLPYLPIIGGAQIQAHGLATSLNNLGHEIVVYASKFCVSEIKKLGWNFDYQLKSCNSAKYPLFKINNKLWYWITANAIKRRILSDKLNIVQLFMSWPWACVAKEINRLNIPVVLRTAGDDIQTNKKLNYGIRLNSDRDKMIKTGLKNINKLIAISPAITREYLQLDLQSNNIIEIGNGVNVNNFTKYNIDKIDVRTKLNLPLDKKLILSVGRNHPKKGFKDLIISLKHLNHDKDYYAVVIVGDKTNELIPFAESLGQKNNFFPINELSAKEKTKNLIFPSKELNELYKSVDYFVLSSHIEGYPNVTLEAAAAKIPVIVANSPGCRDVVTDGVDGIHVSVESPVEISEAIMKLEKKPVLRQLIIDNGFKKALSRDWKNVAEEYLAVYKDILDTKTQFNYQD